MIPTPEQAQAVDWVASEQAAQLRGVEATAEVMAAAGLKTRAEAHHIEAKAALVRAIAVALPALAVGWSVYWWCAR